MFQKSCSFLANCFFKENFKRLHSIYSFVKIWPPLWPHSTHGDHDLMKLECTLSEDASNQVSAFSLFGPTLHQGIELLIKLEFPPPEIAFHKLQLFCFGLSDFEKMFKDFSLNIPMEKFVTLSAIVAQPYPRRSEIEQNWIYNTWGFFHTSFFFFAVWFLISKRFLNDTTKFSEILTFLWKKVLPII